MNATALVHEAWAKLQQAGLTYRSRSHFLALAARAMRQIAVDRARAHFARKRGGDRVRTTLASLPGDFRSTVDLLALDDALRRLAAVRPQAETVATLRVFGGLTVAEVAAALGSSPSSVDRAWVFAKAFLVVELGDD